MLAPVSRVVSPPNLKFLHLSVFQSHALDLLEIRQSVSEWVSRVLRPRQHSIGYMGDGFTGQKTQPTVSEYW